MAIEGVGGFPLILLAGGKSERMGTPKGLLAVHGESFLQYQARRFQEAGGQALVVVLGYGAALYEKALAGLQAVVNPTPERGPFSSLQCGLTWLAREQPAMSGCFVLPIDVPAPDASVWKRLTAELAAGTEVVCPEYAGSGGHPVLLSPAFCALLRRVPTDDPAARLDRQIAALPAGKRCRALVSDAQVTMNLNTPGSFAAWCRYLESSRVSGFVESEPREGETE